MIGMCVVLASGLSALIVAGGGRAWGVLGVSVLSRLLSEGFRLETLVSSMKGFVLLTLVNPSTGERLVYWRRSGRVTRRSVERLRSLLGVPADALVVEFQGRPVVDPDADAELRRMFKRVEYVSERTPEAPTTLEPAPGYKLIEAKPGLLGETPTHPTPSAESR
jgi:hypothetical protein